METNLVDLKIVRTGRIYSGIPLATVEKWMAERRVTADDLVRPVGAQNWMKVSLAPELAGVVRPTPRRAFRIPTPADLGIVAPAKSRPRRKRAIGEDASIDMTPMIDVTFQLLIFFMLTNQAANPSLMEVPEAFHGQGISPEGRQMLLVDDQGRYFLGDQANEDHVASLDALVAEVQKNAVAHADGPLEVTVHAHKQSHHRILRELVERLEDVENIGPIRIGVEEKH